MNKQERDKRRALYVAQVIIFGFLAVNMGIQLYMKSQANW